MLKYVKSRLLVLRKLNRRDHCQGRRPSLTHSHSEHSHTPIKFWRSMVQIDALCKLSTSRKKATLIDNHFAQNEGRTTPPLMQPINAQWPLVPSQARFSMARSKSMSDHDNSPSCPQSHAIRSQYQTRPSAFFCLRVRGPVC